jgi:hypothetical protein
VPARVIIEIVLPMPWPMEASKFEDSTRISWIMSLFGEDARRRSLPELVAPSIVKLLKPTPPTVPPAALVVPSMKPCATYCSVVSGFTPEENLATMIGMFEIMGRFSSVF